MVQTPDPHRDSTFAGRVAEVGRRRLAVAAKAISLYVGNLSPTVTIAAVQS
jgi:hypothetical protein